MDPTIRLLVVALLSWAIGSKHAQLRKLGDVFAVDTRDASVFPRSCLRLLDPNNPRFTIFGPKAIETDVSHALDKIWRKIFQLNTGVINQITDKAYDEHMGTRKLMAAFWSIYPRDQPAGTYRPQGVYKDRLEEVRSRSRSLL